MLLRKRTTNPQIWGGAGSFCLVTSLLLYRFAPEFYASDFLQGMFLGMSLVFNITFLILWRRQRQSA